MLTCSFKLSRQPLRQPTQSPQVNPALARFATRGVCLSLCVTTLFVPALGHPLILAQVSGVEDSWYLGLIYLLAIFVILLVAFYLARKYIRVPSEAEDYLRIPDLPPEVRVWDDTNVEEILAPRSSPRGAIQNILFHLGIRDTGGNLSIQRRYLLEILANEVQARIKLREMAVDHKYYEQEAINNQLHLENQRLELLCRRREIELESRFRRALLEQSTNDRENLSGEIKPGPERQSLNYLYRRHAPHIRCTLHDSLKSHSQGVASISFSPDGRYLASGGWDQQVWIWKLATETFLRPLPVNSNVYSVAFSPVTHGWLLAAGTENGTIRLWDRDLNPQEPLIKGHSEVVESLAFSSDGKLLASASWDETVRLWNVSITPWQPFGTPSSHPDAVAQVAFLPDRSRYLLASVGWDRVLRFEVRDSSSSSPVALADPPTRVTAMAFSPDGKLFAAADLDGVVRLWETTSSVWPVRGNPLFHPDEISCLAFSPNGRLLAAGRLEGTIRLWDVKTGENLDPARRHSAAITSIAFSPDGKLIASASLDKTVKLWDVRVSFPEMPPRL